MIHVSQKQKTILGKQIFKEIFLLIKSWNYIWISETICLVLSSPQSKFLFVRWLAGIQPQVCLTPRFEVLSIASCSILLRNICWMYKISGCMVYGMIKVWWRAGVLESKYLFPATSSVAWGKSPNVSKSQGPVIILSCLRANCDCPVSESTWKNTSCIVSIP